MGGVLHADVLGYPAGGALHTAVSPSSQEVGAELLGLPDELLGLLEKDGNPPFRCTLPQTCQTSLHKLNTSFLKQGLFASSFKGPLHMLSLGLKHGELH